MKETTLAPDPNHPTPGDSPRRLTFEWTQGEQRRLLADRSDEILPTLPPDLRMAPRATSGPRMRI